MPSDVSALLVRAREAAQKAYAPYSRFQVGAAILLENGDIVCGSNQENAAYPSGLCAERTAAFWASANYPDVPFCKIAVIAISQEKVQDRPVPPCGSCRQALIEYEQKFNRKIEITMAGDTGNVITMKSIADLLPCSFSPDYLPE